MINIQYGNLLEQVNSGFIVHQVNCQGVMGSGIAAQIKQKYPQVYSDYLSAVYNANQNNKRTLGDIVLTQISDELSVISLFGQEFYGRSKSIVFTDYDAVYSGFSSIAQLIKNSENQHLHFPKIGCGLANGDWNVVSSIIEETNPDYVKTLWLLPEDQEMIG